MLDLAAIIVLAGSWYWLYSALGRKLSKKTALFASLAASGLAFVLGYGITSIFLDSLALPIGAAAALGFNSIIAVPVAKQLRGGHGSK